MKIAVLSRNPRLYSTRRLVEAGAKGIVLLKNDNNIIIMT